MIGNTDVQKEKRIRVLLAMPGLDAHDIGVKTVAYALRNAGMEVIYLGMRQSTEKIADVAVEEDVDIIGLSSHSAAIITLAKQMIQHLKDRELDIPVVFGGTILAEDRKKLLDIGIKEAFTPGTKLKDISDSIVRMVREKELAM